MRNLPLSLTLVLAALIPAPVRAADRVYWDAFEPPCAHLPGVLSSESLFPYAWWTGYAFGELHTWSWGTAANLYNPDTMQPEVIGVRSFTFNAPDTIASGKLSFPSSTAGISVSLSKRCGSFDGLPAACIGVASSAIQWTTNPAANASRCKLEAGQPYFLNFAWFVWSAYAEDAGSLESSCECPGSTCQWGITATCHFASNSVP